GSPVYMAYVTGQAKLFLDRLYAFKDKTKLAGYPRASGAFLYLRKVTPIPRVTKPWLIPYLLCSLALALRCSPPWL
ncbi:MAG TPA: hypothetical protein VNU93_09130, partial [Verrucomicrobiae bacterium]|nr:hypothetical protein [Verrucomicrobiae bacterium]